MMKRQKELEKERAIPQIHWQNLKSKDEEIRGLAQRLEKEKAKIDLLKDNQGSGYEEEMKRKKQLVKNLQKDLKTKQKERGELQKKSKNKGKTQENIGQLQSSLFEEERKIDALEENYYSMKNIDALKEEEILFQRLNEEDQAIIDDPNALECDKEAARERTATRKVELGRLKNLMAERGK